MTAGFLELPVAFADARAADLGLCLGLAPQPALALRTVDGSGWSAELRILGASHQVLIHQRGRRVYSETVACHLPDSSRRLSPLPARHRSGSDYHFRSRVDRLGSADLWRTVRQLVGDHGDHPHGICARFPGDELGATVLRLDPPTGADGAWISWRTWHTYPGAGEVVATSSRALLAGGSPGRST